MLRVDRFLSIFREANPVEEIRAYHGHEIILPTSSVEDSEDLHDPVPDVWGGTISVAPLSTRVKTLSWGEKFEEISEEKENALAQKKKHIVLEDKGASSLQARKSCFKCRKVKCQCRQAPLPQGEKHQSGCTPPTAADGGKRAEDKEKLEAALAASALLQLRQTDPLAGLKQQVCKLDCDLSLMGSTSTCAPSTYAPTSVPASAEHLQLENTVLPRKVQPLVGAKSENEASETKGGGSEGGGGKGKEQTTVESQIQPLRSSSRKRAAIDHFDPVASSVDRFIEKNTLDRQRNFSVGDSISAKHEYVFTCTANK
mmetsp:Transcript_78886/g.115516  ORF Transcript_78886/g.115516 Transcript_78886/m.115516 type:complete len:313 (-) Transcript_78886:641-1579(-)